MLAKGPDVLDNEDFGGAQCSFGECMVEHTASEGVFSSIDLVVCAGCARRRGERRVPLGLADVAAAVGVDFTQSGDGVD